MMMKEKRSVEKNGRTGGDVFWEKLPAGRSFTKVTALFLALVMVISVCSCAPGAESGSGSVQVDNKETVGTTADAGTADEESVWSAAGNEAVETGSIETDSSETASLDADTADNNSIQTEFSENEAAAEGQEETASLSEESGDWEDSQDENAAAGAGDVGSLTSTQRNSINMLNYMTVLTQEINESKGNQMFLESANSALVNDLYPNAVDTRTQAQVQSLLDTIEGYRMIDVKRNRLEFIYEQNKAKALRKAVPNPVGLLSAVKAQDLMKTALAAIYMAVDAASSYKTASSQADLQYIKEGWELDDAESAELHNSTKLELSYMFNMVRDYSLPGDYALNKESVEDFVSWVENSNVVRRIAWLETNEKTYGEFGSYWLELAKAYYESEEYEKCLEAFKEYESITTRIFRKDLDYANAIPMAIISAAESMDEQDYIDTAEAYCERLLANTKDSDWGLRYFAAQTYLDLYSRTKTDSYLDDAYRIVFDNVNILVDEQKGLNSAYLSDLVEVKAEKDATKREKKEIKQYNKLQKQERKIALPPVSEALYLNCKMLFALAGEKNISQSEKSRIEAILHENGEQIFLTKSLDELFWFDNADEKTNPDEMQVEFDGKSLVIPADCITDRSSVVLEVSGPDGTVTVDDWEVASVKRPKEAECADFRVKLKSKAVEDVKYEGGETAVIKVVTVDGTPEEYTGFTYKVVSEKKLFGLTSIDFERETK